ncbi:MAG: HK97 family phage prohead protease [Spirochaetes bacterium]|nr:HK97 family phage prohead protease [Spirochaetota bacterium]
MQVKNERESGNRQITALFDYSGVRGEAAGRQKVAGKAELIASVPFRLTADVESGQGYPWTLSTFDLDRMGERIDPAGWDFKRYLENPVVEWSHRYDIPAIGKIEGLRVDEDGLHGLVYFNDKSYDPFGWSIGQRVKAGVIRAGSVGFRVIEIEIPSKENSRDGTCLIFRKQELLEFSICNVPANPFSLAEISLAEISLAKIPLAKNKEATKAGTKEEFCLPPFWGNIINNFTGEKV